MQQTLVRPGDALLCIRQMWPASLMTILYNVKFPRANHVYHIREIIENNGRNFVRLVEIVNPVVPELGGEVSFMLQGGFMAINLQDCPEGTFFNPLFTSLN